uniref:Thioredoxin n=1 Tax=Paramormyrops kingsleyae TaxID=1676925 RepID=A0A3B3T8M9_9TELE|nr:thioredoxin [Paramormyrops kingsleyae]
MVREINNQADFDKTLKDAGQKLVVIDFTATWCGPCKAIAPIFQKLSDDYQNVVFLKVDVDEAQDVASSCGVSCMPTFQFYKNGVKIGEFSGADKNKLEEMVKKHM